MLIRLCPKCKIEKEGAFCSECGTKLIIINRCPSCKRDTDVTDKYCSVCGFKMDDIEVRIPQTRATIRP